jgi:8-oxo-dGTP pyrophosphatase MutT (NUDIX family)
VALVVRDRRLLVIRRSHLVAAPGAFCFPGGGIEPGETEPQALIRELQEELAVTVRPVRRVWHSLTPWNVELAWWAAELDPLATPVPHPLEVASVHWHTPAETASLPGLLEGNQHFLVALARGELTLEGLG